MPMDSISMSSIFLCTFNMDAGRKFEVAVSLNPDLMTSFRVNK